MIDFLIFLASVLLIIAVIVVAMLCNIKIIDIKNGKVEFWQPRKEKTFSFLPSFTLDPVISEDGKIYKIHLIVNIITEKALSPSNWLLKIHGLGRFSFKQYFIQDQNGNRLPLGKISKLPLNPNETFVIGLEFEPEGAYTELIFVEKNYKANLTCKTASGDIGHHFSFSIRSRNIVALRLSAIEAKRRKMAVVTSFPILIK